jgi:DNA polymerase III subunit epsilon
MKYAIVDIETTGGNPRSDKITEIAVVLHDGGKVVSQFSSLVNPECRIPYNITAITGITNEMVADAPKFYEIARQLVEMTRDSVFVAHNVAFDYGFVKNEFKRLGYDYSREQLCTVRLSRKILPGHRSYSLGKLCDDLQIAINGRHRAMGDAEATAVLFDILLKTEASSNTGYITNPSELPRDIHPDLDPGIFKKLPEEPGVYYFYNNRLEVIYIGKSKNIRSRVLSHFSNNSTGKAMQMRSQTADISFEVTGSELIALLKESYEIKKYKPLFNRAQRKAYFRYGLFSFRNREGYICFSLEKITEEEKSPLLTFTTKAEAHSFINAIIDKFGLCQKLCGIYPSEGHCFHYEIGACKGACTGQEPVSSYNARAIKVEEKYKFDYSNILIFDPGRNNEEQGVIKIEHGKYIGFGYFSSQFAAIDETVIHDCIQVYPDNHEVQHIISQYLRNNQVNKLLVY